MVRDFVSDEEFRNALALGDAECNDVLAESVKYISNSQQIEVELKGGICIRFPKSSVDELSELADASLHSMELSPAGASIDIEDLDLHISVEGLLTAILPRSLINRTFARMGGKAKSTPKSQASRLNGLKGGRPRKTTTPSSTSSFEEFVVTGAASALERMRTELTREFGDNLSYLPVIPQATSLLSRAPMHHSPVVVTRIRISGIEINRDVLERFIKGIGQDLEVEIKWKDKK